jgi:hypothetical protein
MINYSMGKIYRIVSKNTDKIYVGSTTKDNLKTRLQQHESNYRLQKSYYTSYEILKLGDYDIELVEECNCNNKKELRMREKYWIDNSNCVNQVKPGRTRKERDNLLVNKLKKAEQDKKYYEKNKDRLLEKNREYNKDYDKIRYKWYSSMGGNPFKINNSLLRIDVDLFS